jgi:stage V sporulation protein B
MILVGSACTIVVPQISTLASAGKAAAAARLVVRTLLLSLLIGLMTGLLLWCFADQLGEFFYGRSDLNAMIHLAGLCAPLLYVTAATGSLLVGIGAETRAFQNALFQQLLLLILLILLTGIPQLNIYGYMLAIALSNGVLLAQNLHCLHRTFYT